MIRIAPVTRPAIPQPTDASQAELFNATIRGGSAEKAHAMRGEASQIHARVERSGHGKRLRDLMPRLHAAMKTDMTILIAAARAARGYADLADLTRAGYAEPLVLAIAPSLFGEADRLVAAE